MSASSPIRVGLVGAGYIADWHAGALARIPGVTTTAVCDLSLGAAEELARGHGAKAFGSLTDMIGADVVDAVHILTPPQTHAVLGQEALAAGLHVLLEKPAALTSADVDLLEQATNASGKVVSVCHNFLALPSYERLKTAISEGKLGRIASAEINWRFPLQPLRTGPYGLWMLRDTQNIMLELGPHLFAFASDLFGGITVSHVETSHPVELPGGGSRPQVFRVFARAGGVDLTFHVSLLEGYDDRSLSLRGAAGMARLDFAADTLILQRDNASDIVVNPLRRELGQSRQHRREGIRNAASQLRSMNRNSPYGLSFHRTFEAHYKSVAGNARVDPRFSIATAGRALKAIEAVNALVPQDVELAAPKTVSSSPSAMVIGGTGFVGRALTRALVADGRTVRVLSRGRTGPFADISDKVEISPVSLRDQCALAEAMSGMDVVYNLAKSTDSSWDDALKNDVAVAEAIGEAAVSAGVGRLVYSGTIASYDMSDPAATITEDTDFGDMSDRNVYARSKAECERRLTALSKSKGLPLVIARPGIVVGETGPLQHWGIGRWHGAGAVRIWGDGENILPFVLNDDVADGLVKMAGSEKALGQSYNLIGEPMLSARGYFDAIAERHGTRIEVAKGSLLGLHLSTALKYLLKRHVLGNKSAQKTSYRDMKSRAHLSAFSNARAKADLGWAPETDRNRFLERAIDQANLFGF